VRRTARLGSDLPFACSSATTSISRQSSHKAEAAASAQTATLFDEKPLWRELLSGLVIGMFQAVCAVLQYFRRTRSALHARM
jgi:hypothetical protein